MIFARDLFKQITSEERWEIEWHVIIGIREKSFAGNNILFYSILFSIQKSLSMHLFKEMAEDGKKEKES